MKKQRMPSKDDVRQELLDQLGVERPMTYDEAKVAVLKNQDIREVLLWFQLGEWTDEQRAEMSGLIQSRLHRSAVDLYRPYGPVLSMAKEYCRETGVMTSFYYIGSFEWISESGEPLWDIPAGKGDGVINVKVLHGSGRYDVVASAAADLLPGQMLLVVQFVSQHPEQSMMFAKLGYCMPVAVFEDGPSGTIGILFIRDYGMKSDHARSKVHMCFSDACGRTGIDVPFRYVASACRPKFYALTQRKAADVRDKGSLRTSLLNLHSEDEGPVYDAGKKSATDLSKGYYCIDRSYAGTPDRGTGGDTDMKSGMRRINVPLPSGRYPVAEAPCLIVDVDRMSVMEFRPPKEQPFLLDSHFLAYRLADIQETDSPDGRDDLNEIHKAYRDAAARLDRRLVQWCSDLEAGMSDVTGFHYHMSMDEKMYMLDTYGAEMLSDRKRVRSLEDRYAGVCLKPCGFDLTPYLEELDSRGLVEFVKTGEDSGYCRLTKADKSVAMLFSFIMNARIAGRYNSLTPEERKEWDGRSWVADGYGRSKMWRKSRGEAKEFSYPDTSRPGEHVKVFETREMRAEYFSALFDVDARSLTSLKSTAIDKSKTGKKEDGTETDRQKVIQAINAVDHRMSAPGADGAWTSCGDT